MTRKLNENIEKLNTTLEKHNVHEFMTILGSKREIFKRNFFAGLARGIGMGIGFTIITAILVIILHKIVTLNIPIIGKYISEIVEIVEKNNI